MAREILVKRLTKTLAQAFQGSSITAGTFNLQTPTVINNLTADGGENARGAIGVDLWVILNSTYMPNSGAYAEVWAERSMDGVDYSDKGFVMDIAVGTSQTIYRLGIVYDLAPYTKFYLKAMRRNFDAKIEIFPIVPELQ